MSDDFEDTRLDEPETRKLSLPGENGPFSGHKVQGKYYGQDVQKIGKEGPEQVAVYGEDVAKKWFERDFKLAFERNHDRIIAVTGREGFGKSTVAIHLARAANPDFSVDDVIFDRSTLAERLECAEHGETIVVDEAGISMFSQEWWDEMQREVVKKLVAGRVKGLRVFFVSPHLGMLNNQIRQRRLDGWVYACPVGRYGRGEAQYKEPVENKYSMSIYWQPRLTMKFSGISGEFWDEYAEKKENFVDAVYEEGDDVDGNLKQLKTVWKLKEKGWTSEEIAEVMTISASTVRDKWSKLDKNETLLEKVKEA